MPLARGSSALLSVLLVFCYQGHRQGVRGDLTEPPSRKDHLVNNDFPLILCCMLVNNSFPLHLSVALIINRDREVVNMGMVYANVLVTFT